MWTISTLKAWAVGPTPTTTMTTTESTWNTTTMMTTTTTTMTVVMDTATVVDTTMTLTMENSTTITIMATTMTQMVSILGTAHMVTMITMTPLMIHTDPQTHGGAKAITTTIHTATTAGNPTPQAATTIMMSMVVTAGIPRTLMSPTIRTTMDIPIMTRHTILMGPIITMTARTILMDPTTEDTVPMDMTLMVTIVTATKCTTD